MMKNDENDGKMTYSLERLPRAGVEDEQCHEDVLVPAEPEIRMNDNARCHAAIVLHAAEREHRGADAVAQPLVVHAPEDLIRKVILRQHEEHRIVRAAHGRATGVV